MDIEASETVEGMEAEMEAALATGDNRIIYRLERLQGLKKIRLDHGRKAKALTNIDALEKLYHETQVKLEMGKYETETAGGAKTAEGMEASMEAALASGDPDIIYREQMRQEPIKIRLEHESRIKALKTVPDMVMGTSEVDKNRKETIIFLSYSRNDKMLADSIDEKFKLSGINLTRDTRDIEYKQSIKEFMKKVRSSGFVIIILSKTYLESSNCMYEMLEFVKDADFKNRIIPIIDKSAEGIFSAEGRFDYLSYWDHKKEDLEKKSAWLIIQMLYH